VNVCNTKLFWPSCDGSKLREDLLPHGIARPVLGVKLLGGAVSKDDVFIRESHERVVKAFELMHLLPQLREPQSELLFFVPIWVLLDVV